MTTSRHTLPLAGLALLVGCSEAPSRGSPDVGDAPTTGDPGGQGPPTSGPGGSGETPTTGSSPATDTTGTDTTGDPASSTTGEPGPSCGDGVTDLDEQCDDGAGNSDHAFCTTKCQLNFCGDGHLFLGWELCDEGSANSDSYGSACSAQCTPGARCGDHIIQPEEECDLGADNGGPKGDEQGIACDASCTSLALRAFVSSQAFTGDMDGLYGADKKCRDAASAAGLPEPHRFHAYLSTPDNPANNRFPGPNAEPLPYILVTGKKIADSHASLLYQGPLGEGISVTELGASLYNADVATNTAPNGASHSPDQHCLAWTSADPLLEARVGITFPGDPGDYQVWLSDGEWTSALTRGCQKAQLHLYCLEI